VAVSFILAGIAWVLATDVILYTATRDPMLIARVETAKGWIFVGLGAFLLYVVTLQGARRFLRAQALTAAVVESIGDGLLVLGPDRRIQYANRAAARVLRCQDAGELVGMGAKRFTRRYRVSYPDGSLVPPNELASQRVFDEGGPLSYTAVMHPPGCGEVIIKSTAAAVRMRVGETASMVVSVLHDITDSYLLEKLRDQFFAAAAHSLKTPVAIIKTNVQVLLRSAAPPLARSLVAIERQCDRIDRLVQNLLVLGRFRSHSLALHQEEIGLQPMVEQVAGEMGRLFVHHPVNAEIADSPRVYADPERLAMALRNVIDEALRSSISGAPLTVLLRRHDDQAAIGIRYRPVPPEERSRETYGDYDDIGICRNVTATVLQAHGGTLSEESAGSETTAWIRLPVSERPDEPRP
jgi:two-component system, NtrC family, sensor histidine kinase KinB